VGSSLKRNLSVALVNLDDNLLSTTFLEKGKGSNAKTISFKSLSVQIYPFMQYEVVDVMFESEYDPYVTSNLLIPNWRPNGTAELRLFYEQHEEMYQQSFYLKPSMEGIDEYSTKGKENKEVKAIIPRLSLVPKGPTYEKKIVRDTCIDCISDAGRLLLSRTSVSDRRSVYFASMWDDTGRDQYEFTPIINTEEQTLSLDFRPTNMEMDPKSGTVAFINDEETHISVACFN